MALCVLKKVLVTVYVYDCELLGVSRMSFVSMPVSLGAYAYVCVCGHPYLPASVSESLIYVPGCFVRR